MGSRIKGDRFGLKGFRSFFLIRIIGRKKDENWDSSFGVEDNKQITIWIDILFGKVSF